MAEAILTQAYKPILTKDECIYTACYCEENIWKAFELAVEKKTVNPDELFVVFISNDTKTVPIWFQKKCDNVLMPVIWDYHVIAVHRNSKNMTSYIYDFDTLMDFPEIFQNYVRKSFLQVAKLNEKFNRFYRVVSCKYFLENFSSDRSHMINSDDEFTEPPPKYDCIKSKRSKNNLQEFISTKDNGHGVVLDEEKFRNFFKF